MPKKMTAHRLGYEDACTFAEDAPSELRELLRSKNPDAGRTPLTYIRTFVPQVDPKTAQDDYERGWRLGAKTCLRRVTRS